MENKFLTKKLCIVVMVFLMGTLFYSEAFAWGGGCHSGSRGHSEGWRGERSSHRDYGRSCGSDFLGFQIVLTPEIGNIVLGLPIGYQTVRVKDVPYHCHNGSYYKRHHNGCIVIPAPHH